MTDHPRLIEVAFPLKQASLDSVHEKNVRHGHISTLHIWPARRPLAACRAALIATLLPDPGDDEKRKELLEKLAGKIKPKSQKKKMPSGKVENIESEETEGGILHWGREASPDLDFFREEIRKAYGGNAPKVLDPFAGGGAIPLEAMRMGCEATAIDINPVAWFILKCTLEYPQKLAGQKRPLPEFVQEKGQKKEKKQEKQGQMFGEEQEGDLADHVRAWGNWVLEKARQDLAKFYPIVDNKPTVAYLWARTVKCKNCRALVPLLKTRWLCKKEKKRVLLTISLPPGGGCFVPTSLTHSFHAITYY
jgi:adenine-specific DNA methylase